MANVKISALPSASALAGTEVVPAVQGGATVGATIAQILANSAQVIAKNAVANSTTGSTAETVLATITLPALAANTLVRLEVQLGYTNSANLKTFKVRLGGLAGTVLLNQTENASATLTLRSGFMNRGATNSQIAITSDNSAAAGSGWGSSGNAGHTATIDTSLSTTLVITGQLATSTETITLQYFSAELML